MKLIVATYGTDGDTRPLSALCRALMDQGHEVWLFADGATLGSARALGVPATALAGDIKAVVQEGKTGGFKNLAAAFARIAKDNTAAWMSELAAAGRGCDAVLFSGLAAFAGLSAAEYLGVPAIGLGLIPITPTKDFPSPFLPLGLLPRWLNRASHRLINALVWRAFRQATNEARADYDLPPRGPVWSDHPMLYGISPSLLKRPDDWPDNAVLCGQWLARTPDWTPPEDLAAFLQAGEKPLYVGFGSMAGFDLQSVIAAVAGRRALFYAGWSGIGRDLLPANFLPIGETPHDWLFPRTSLVIHHGGSGTSHSAARAGVPSVVIPFAGDQAFWADRLHRAGVAAKGPALAPAIAFAENPETRKRAEALGRHMQAEDGAAIAVLAITSYLGKADATLA